MTKQPGLGPISPEPVADDRPDHLPPYLSNGVVGLRVRRVPLRSGLAVVSGLEGEHPVAGITCVPSVPYPLAGDIKVGSALLSHHWENVHDIVQRYDFETGELHSSFVFSYDGLDAEVDVLTFCCRSRPSLVAQEITVRTSATCEVTLSAGVDPTGVPGEWIRRWLSIPDVDGDELDGVMHWQTLGALASLGVAYWTEYIGDAADRSKNPRAEAPLTTSYREKIRKGQRVTVRQVASLVPSANHQQPHWEATRLAAFGRRIGFDRLRRENAEAWRELWRGRIVLVGANSKWQELADAAFFYLHTSTHPGSLSTHPFGLAQWFGYHYYYGHVMWDVEAFLMPPLLLTNPDAALAMLDYRTRCLEAARENARLNGWKGLQFPWQSSPSRGEESAPGLGPAASYEHHITPDVAKAFAEYMHATGSDVFAKDRAWPVLAGAADWLTSRAVQSAKGWEIHEAMGIAERKEPADNAAFVNMAATVALQEAIRCGERLGYEVPHEWRAMADGLVLPVNRANVILDHDGFTRREEKAATPAALAGLFPLGYRATADVEQATLSFYLDMADDYVGSPMLSSLLGVWAAMLGDRARSGRMFEEGYAAFASKRFNVMHEYRSDRFPEEPVSGPFLANAGGFLLACLYGLPGLRLGPGEPETWCVRPVVMPDLWDAVEVERIWVRGRPASLRAKYGDRAATIERS
jgi:trehalose/maltose hydrolase-like predicted phosphorylase